MSDEYKPGCFGSPLCYSENKEPCVSCSHITICSISAMERSLALTKRFGFTTTGGLLKRKIEKETFIICDTNKVINNKPIFIEDIKQNLTLPHVSDGVKLLIVNDERAINKIGKTDKAINDILKKIKKYNLNIETDLTRGVNSFEFYSPTFMRVAFSLLLARNVLKKDELHKALIEQLGFLDSQADQTCLLIFQTLRALKFFTFDDEVINDNVQYKLS